MQKGVKKQVLLRGTIINSNELRAAAVMLLYRIGTARLGRKAVELVGCSASSVSPVESARSKKWQVYRTSIKGSASEGVGQPVTGVD